MKKYLIALLFGMSLMSMQTASAATLTLEAPFLIGAGSVVTGGPAETVEGASSGAAIFAFPGVPSFSMWTLTVSEATDVQFDFTGISSVASLIDGLAFSTTSFIASLAAGTYIFSTTSAAGTPFTFTAAVSNVPVPAAVWLFGSAIAGLIGVTRRKSQPTLAV